jgi:hypothetical protein
MLCRYDPDQRPTAAAALEHEFFMTEPYPASPVDIAALMHQVLAQQAAMEAQIAAVTALGSKRRT